jgi:biotin carboxyl carrier protein
MPTYAPVTTSVRGVPRESVTAIVAEMVANVMEVSVDVGSSVAAGDAVVLLESMKMEIPVIAERGGVVRAVKVAPGDVVQEGDVLVEITH